MTLSWNERYPDQRVLKDEVNCMLEAFVKCFRGYFEKFLKIFGKRVDKFLSMV